jgi:sigma-B regulation protein RsbU (phosphoserine phosphatase)
MQMDISPGGLLMLSNIIMDQDFDRFGMFMTALVGKIDLKTNTLDYASAGHCPPIIYKNGEIEMLDTQDYMLGVDPEVEYKTYSIPFEKGDKLLAYTDGITDIIGPDGEMIGIEPLLYACSTEFKSKGVKEACEKIFTEALMVSGRNLQDDITMIGIERK